eukprot:sb/3470731/
MSGSGERWTRERQFSRDLDDSMRLSRDSTPDRDLPRNKTKRDEQARCPKCRVDISRSSCARNLAVEQTLSELLTEYVILNPHRTDDFLPQLYYESSKFNLFGQYWLVRGRIQGDEHNFQRSLSLKIFQKGKNPIEIEYCFLRDPYCTVQIKPEVQKHCFTNDDGETEYHELKLVNPLEVNNLLAEKSIKLRLYMAQVN